MGAYDGAEVTQLIGLYLLQILSHLIPIEDLGLYRDDGLAVLEGNGPMVERLRKEVIKIFKDNGLKVTTEANLKVTDFLDITLDLSKGTFSPT